MTILCGDPAVCCLDSEECVDGKLPRHLPQRHSLR
jgi:hypothetical protein